MSGMVVAHNLQSMFSNRALGIVNDRKAKSSEKLASGYRINRAADDAAGLSISEKMRKKIRGLNQGADNMQDGVSLCQIADGALAETQDLLQRMNELCIKSANGTMSASDRQDVQNEIGNLKEEIDRIANTTSFNNYIYPLKGGPYKVTTEPASNIPFENIKLVNFDMADVGIGQIPFTKNDDPDHLVLQAVVDKSDSSVNGATFNLIYGNGSTSSSGLLLRYQDSSGEYYREQVAFRDMTVDPNRYRYDDSTKTYSRTFSYSDSNLSFEITQTVKLDDENKNYQINHAIKNTGSTTIERALLMEHFDTAYNNDDYNEEHYVAGTKITNNSITGVYGRTITEANASGLNGFREALNDEYLAPDTTNYIFLRDELDVYSNGISIVSMNNALPFTEKIEFTGSWMQSIGHYNRIKDWSYYNNLDMNLGGSTNREDLGLSVFFVAEDITSNETKSIGGLKYGITDIRTDPNINGNDYNYGTITKIVDMHGVDIQCSDEVPDRINIPLVIATAEGIGLEGKEGTIDASTLEGARKGIDLVSKALLKVNEYRTNFGVHQNRLEHAIKVNDNSSENTQAAESRVRDTDMASEMVRYSKESILQQAGQSMLAQANQQPQGILQLLQ